MSEHRKPETVILLRTAAMRGKSLKVEVFSGAQFRLDRYATLLGTPIGANNRHNFVRLRVAGKWFPRKERTLYTRRQFLRILKKEVFRESDRLRHAASAGIASPLESQHPLDSLAAVGDCV